MEETEELSIHILI